MPFITLNHHKPTREAAENAAQALRSEMHQLRAAERAETEQQLEHLARCAGDDLMEDSWSFNGDLMGIYGDLMGIYGDLMGIYGDLMGIYVDLMGIYGD